MEKDSTELEKSLKEKGLEQRPSKALVERKNDIKQIINPFSILRLEMRKGAEVPNASLVYGVSAACFLVFGLYHLLTGSLFNGILVILIAGALFGYALYYMRLL